MGTVGQRFLIVSPIPLVGEGGWVNLVCQHPHFTKRWRGSEEKTLPHMLCTLQAGFPDVAIQRQVLLVRQNVSIAVAASGCLHCVED